MKKQTIRPRGPVDAVVSLPGSKSITNRALLLAALCDGRTVLEGALDSEDTQMMFSALKQLGLNVLHDTEHDRMVIEGQGGLFSNEKFDLYVGNSGRQGRSQNELPLDDLTRSRWSLDGEKSIDLYVGNSGRQGRSQNELPLDDLTRSRWSLDGKKSIDLYVGNSGRQGRSQNELPLDDLTRSRWSLDGKKSIDLYVGNSGTTARFLAAALCFSDGNYRLYGKPRMHQRPIRDLVDALRQLGADICCENDDDCPPLIINSNHSEEGGGSVPALKTATVAGNISSQYLSALLMSAPLVAGQGVIDCDSGCDIEIRLSGDLVSRPYIDLTLRMMRTFGVEPKITNDFSCFRFLGTNSKQAKYRSPGVYRIEPDASAASYFFATAALCGGSVKVPGLSKDSLQGDVRFVDCLKKMGCEVFYGTDSIKVFRDPTTPLRGVSVDMNSISDTAQTLAVVALFAEGPTEIRNIEHVRFKETDRISDLATELRKFGAEVEERRDGLKITPPNKPVPAEVATYDDHRMAMSFALAGLRLSGVEILDPDCCQKTFSRFFDVLDELK